MAPLASIVVAFAALAQGLSVGATADQTVGSRDVDNASGITTPYSNGTVPSSNQKVNVQNKLANNVDPGDGVHCHEQVYKDPFDTEAALWAIDKLVDWCQKGNKLEGATRGGQSHGTHTEADPKNLYHAYFCNYGKDPQNCLPDEIRSGLQNGDIGVLGKCAKWDANQKDQDIRSGGGYVSDYSYSRRTYGVGLISDDPYPCGNS